MNTTPMEEMTSRFRASQASLRCRNLVVIPASRGHSSLWLPPPVLSPAFTLVEVLVVVAIVGILAALLTPTLKSVVEKSRQVQCMNNLRNIYGGFRLYAGEHNGQIPMGYDPGPPQTFYPFQIGPYLNNGVWQWNPSANYPPYFVCPSQSLGKAKWIYGSYSMNANVSIGGPYRFLQFDGLSSRMLFLFDGVTSGLGNSPASIVKRHNNGANLLFLDGHVEWRTQMDAPNTGFWIGR